MKPDSYCIFPLFSRSLAVVYMYSRVFWWVKQMQVAVENRISWSFLLRCFLSAFISCKAISFWSLPSSGVAFYGIVRFFSQSAQVLAGLNRPGMTGL